jgi:hypothetical protein
MIGHAMTATLPDHNAVFLRFFSSLYRPEDLARRKLPATFPDMMRSFPPGTRAEDATAYDAAYGQQFLQIIEGLVDSEARASAGRAGIPVPANWRQAPVPELLAWIHALDGFWTAERIAQVQTASDTTTAQNPFMGPCLGFGALLGATLVKMSRSEWLPETPYWDASVLHVPSGHEAFVFHWAIKKFSSYGVDDGFAAKMVTVYKMWEEPS